VLAIGLGATAARGGERCLGVGCVLRGDLGAACGVAITV
jgi:hypothetical protein